MSKIRGTPLEPLGFEADERLWQARGWARGSYSQHGEDRIVLEHFRSLGRPGIYVDVGANYPVKISNTYLLYRHGWHGLTIEPIPRLSRRHRRLRPRDIHVNAAIGAEAKELTFYEFDASVLSTFDEERKKHALEMGSRLKQTHQIPVLPLSRLIREHLADRPVDFLSVDTEGFDMQVLRSADWDTFRPALIAFEVGDDAPASEGPREFLEARGYQVKNAIGCNVLMARAS